eukprot:5549046-Pyramimonas_sp.AAC.1
MSIAISNANFSGEYILPGQVKVVLTQKGAVVTANLAPQDSGSATDNESEFPTTGNVSDDLITLMGMTGQLVLGTIRWDNNTMWTRTKSMHIEQPPALAEAVS